MPPIPGTDGYANEAEKLLVEYEERTFESVHAGILDLLPPPFADVLDVGAGTGRDAAGFAKQGYHVTAVEPVAEMREGAIARHPEPNITWIDDGLPDLATVTGADRRFDLIMLTAVFMHLDAPDRDRSLETLAGLLRPGGRMAFLVRHGPVPPGRVMYEIDSDALIAEASSLGLKAVFRQDRLSPRDTKPGVTWSRLVFEKGDRT